MAEAALVFAIVALAAGWTVWSVFLPARLKARILRRKPKGCGCAD